ncbi:hypothetical protein L6R49_29360, partial [Myxococcota bacterium]|nr:hypothetical protein [Myxococcota bacterium]
AEENLRAALKAVEAYRLAVAVVKAQAREREERREALLAAHKARRAAVQAEASALMKAVPRRLFAQWDAAERAAMRAAMRAAATTRLDQALGVLPHVPEPEPPPKLPTLRLTPAQRKALLLAQRRAAQEGVELIPQGVPLVRPYKKRARRFWTAKEAARAARRRRERPEEPIQVRVSPPGPWSISEDGPE